MDTNEKKPKRPRIGQVRSEGEQASTFSNISASQAAEGSARSENTEQRTYRAQSYQPRQYQRPYSPAGYQNRQNGYNQNGYQNRPGGYQPRPQHHYQPRPYNTENSEGENNGENATTQQRPYQPRPYNNRQGAYNNQGRQNGYNNTNRQESGYNNQGRQGGYNNNRQGGYNNNRQGGYNNQGRQGGYNNNRQGGYNNQGRQGGYNNNRQGGYNNRQGGYNNNRPGAFNNQNRRNNQGGFMAKGKSFTPRPKQIEYEMPIPDPNEQIRLNKFMANAGICSRREADEFIQQGLVKVNGNVVTELGTKITHSDVVEYDEKVVALERKCYILLNKPKDCVTTSDDPNGRLTVMDIVKGACKERIYPVGRLDRNTTGVLLLTNDGDLASKLTHPQYVKKKIYHVWTDKDVTEDDMQRIADGIELEDGEIHADAIGYATETDRNQVGIEIHSGRNRIVRRIFESLGYHVTKLDRVYFAGLTKKNLPRGRWRYLTQEEVNFLKMGSFE